MKLKFALETELEESIHIARKGGVKDERTLAEFLFPYFVAAIARRLGGPATRSLLLRTAEALEGAPAAGAGLRLSVPLVAEKETIWCHRSATTCGRQATGRRFDPTTGKHRPVCDEHAKGATPMELRPL